MSGRNNRFPFTASQWQELEHQALIFKYMVSGFPIPPDLLITIKRSCCFHTSPPHSAPPNLFPHQHIGSWNCFQIGLGRKIDPEPGRCRRTDGKKWRCAKEAYPDSKYCERHMHRGKNRSRKPVELSTCTSSTTNGSSFVPSPAPALSYSNSNPHQSFNLNSTHLLLDSASGYQSHTDLRRRNRYVYGVEEEVDEHAFFSEPSGKIRSFSDLSMDDDSWQLAPLTMSSSSSKQRSCSNEYSYLQLRHHNNNNTPTREHDHKQPEEGSQKTVHRFFDECPPQSSRDSWLDLDHKSSSNAATVSATTNLSISIPSAHDFPIFTSRAP